MSECLEQPRYVCALGSQQTVLAIKKAIPIIHAGPGCSAKMSNSLSIGGDGSAGASDIPSTNSTSNEVIFGGIQKLRETIDGALKVFDSDLFVVLTGCTAEIVGDDVTRVAKEYRQNGVPIVNAETGGFKANNYAGHEMVVKAIISQLLEGIRPQLQKGLVNVFSDVPYQNAFWRGDLENLKELLEKIGLRVNILFGQTSAGVEEWKSIPHAQFNLVVSPWVGLETAKLLQEMFGTPYLHCPVLPVGALESGRFLRTVGEFAGIEKSRVEAAVSRNEEWYYDYFQSLATLYTHSRSPYPCRFYSVADSLSALSLSSYLIHEMGFTPEDQFIVDNPPQSETELIRGQFRQLYGDVPLKLTFENDGGKIQRILKEKGHRPGETLILGSNWERSVAAALKGYLLEIGFPVRDNYILNKSYVGFRGGLTFLEDLFTNVFIQNPNAVKDRVNRVDQYL